MSGINEGLKDGQQNVGIADVASWRREVTNGILQGGTEHSRAGKDWAVRVGGGATTEKSPEGVRTKSSCEELQEGVWVRAAALSDKPTIRAPCLNREILISCINKPGSEVTILIQDQDIGVL